MASGVKVADNVSTLYNDMKVKKKDANLMEHVRLVVFKIIDNEIQVTKILRQKDVCSQENIYKVFTGEMVVGQCCYILYDCNYETADTGKDDLVLVMWTPDSSVCKDKMLYASSKSYIRSAMSGVKHQLEINDPSDYAMEAFAAKLGKDVKSIEGHKI